MTITTEDLTSMAEGRYVFRHEDGLALAAELITARAALEAVDQMFSYPGGFNATTIKAQVRAALANARGEAK